MRWISVGLAGTAAWMAVAPQPRRSPRFGAPNPRGVVAIAAAASCAALLTWALAADPVLAAATAGVVTVIAPGVAATRRDRVRMTEASRWPDLLAGIRARLGAGEPVPVATLEAARRIGPPFHRLAQALEESGRRTTFADTLGALAEDWSDPIADRVFGTLTIADRVGGPRVGEVLATLSASVADDLRLRLAHEAATTEQRLTALIALVAPWALLVLTVVTNPAAADSFSGSGGRVVVMVGLGATVTGFALTRRSLRLSTPGRPAS
ncbi:hypothetical protein HQ535_07105 [bacterium]|nr:hypothetical protein [bacterium]